MIFTIPTSLPCLHGRRDDHRGCRCCRLVTERQKLLSVKLLSVRLLERLTLVEEASLGHARLVLGRHLDVGRGQQEHLVRHSLDAPVQPEDQPCGKVDEPLGITVDHLGQVHDHRGALAKVLSDGTSFIVCARVQRRDTGKISSLGGRGHVASWRWLTCIRDQLRADGTPSRTVAVGLGVIRLVVLLVFLLIGVVAILVPVVILDKAEVDRHLVHRAGHPSALRHHCPQQPRCDGHYRTEAGRPPSNAVPTRTCVAPAAMASSRSPLIPAEIMAASGWAALTVADISASVPNAADGAAASGTTAITPPSTRPGSSATASAIRGTCAATAPPRRASPSRLT